VRETGFWAGDTAKGDDLEVVSIEEATPLSAVPRRIRRTLIDCPQVDRP
jgi:hypothetical protein